MTNMTLAIPEELHELMRRHKQIKWSEVAREALWNEANKMEIMNKILSKSKITERDAKVIGDKIKEGIAKRHNL